MRMEGDCIALLLQHGERHGVSDVVADVGIEDRRTGSGAKVRNAHWVDYKRLFTTPNR
jgi:hypothetical protein